MLKNKRSKFHVPAWLALALAAFFLAGASATVLAAQAGVAGEQESCGAQACFQDSDCMNLPVICQVCNWPQYTTCGPHIE